MTTQVNVLATGGHKCLYCGLIAKSRMGLKRHQSTAVCMAQQEELLYEREGFKRINYNFLRKTGRREKIDSCVIARARRLGVPVFDSPVFHQYAYVPTWFWLAWTLWPEKVEGVVHTYSKWVPKRGGGYKRVRHDELGVIPNTSFDTVVQAAIASPPALDKLRLRIAAGVLEAYLKEGADPA